MNRRQALFALVLAALPGCDLFLGDTKMGQGQLYQSGDTRYDPYFDQVHKEQIAAASWQDEAKQSRKPIVTALNLKPDASNGTILTATSESKHAHELEGPVNETTNNETARAQRMHAEAQRLEDLRGQGDGLRKQAVADRDNLGAQKADDKAVKQKDEVKRELSASSDVLDKLINDARRASREAEELANHLTASWTGHHEDERKIDVNGKVQVSPAATPAAPAPAPKKKVAPAGAATAKPAPAPAATKPDEVFNP